MMSQEELKQLNAFNLCQAYYFHKDQGAKKELIRRDVISSDEWSLIEKGSLAIGMSELAFICSWGEPDIQGTMNETVTKYGVNRQWVYRCDYCKTRYVYTENGKITSWQN
jgi:hypothetical protein